MSTLPFLRHELRRHLATLVVGLLSLAMLPMVHRLTPGGTRYWDGAWNVWGAVLALYVVMPILVMAMAASGWARERSLHTLEWLYARPLSSARVYALRALAIAAPALVWSAIAFAIQGARYYELELALSAVPGIPGPGMLFALQLVLALGAGLLASALASSGESAFRASVLLSLGAWTAALVAGRAIGHAAVLRAASSAGTSLFLDHATAALVAALAVAMMIGAWLAMRDAPENARAARRAMVTSTGLAIGAVVGFLILLDVPLLVGAEGPHALWLGGDHGLTFGAARAIGGASGGGTDLFTHPILRQPGRSRILRSPFVLRPGPWTRGPWANAARGAAVVGRFQDDGWSLVEADGTVTDLALTSPGAKTAIGWSPSGERFAWLSQPWPRSQGTLSERPPAPSQVIFLEANGALRAIDVPRRLSTEPRAAWIDDRAILVTDGPTDEVGGRWWSVVSAESTATATQELSDRLALAAPALASWPVGTTALPRLGGRPLVLLADIGHPSTLLWTNSRVVVRSPGVEPAPLRAATLDPSSGTLQEVMELDSRISAASLGNLDDGTLVWAQPDAPLGPPEWGAGVDTGIYGLNGIEASPRLLCTLPHGRAAQFLGQSGPWAIWDTVLFTGYELWGCNLQTGASRPIVEWQPWAHALATIGDQGLWTPSGWKAIEP